MRAFIGGCAVYGAFAEADLDMPRQLFTVNTNPGLQSRTAWQPRTSNPITDPTLHLGQPEVVVAQWSPEQFGIPAQQPTTSSRPASASVPGFFCVLAGAAAGYAAATVARKSRAKSPVMMAGPAMVSEEEAKRAWLARQDSGYGAGAVVPTAGRPAQTASRAAARSPADGNYGRDEYSQWLSQSPGDWGVYAANTSRVSRPAMQPVVQQGVQPAVRRSTADGDVGFDEFSTFKQQSTGNAGGTLDWRGYSGVPGATQSNMVAAARAAAREDAFHGPEKQWWEGHNETYNCDRYPSASPQTGARVMPAGSRPAPAPEADLYGPTEQWWDGHAEVNNVDQYPAPPSYAPRPVPRTPPPAMSAAAPAPAPNASRGPSVSVESAAATRDPSPKPADAAQGWVVPTAGYQQPDAYMPRDYGIARGGYTGRPAASADQPRPFVDDDAGIARGNYSGRPGLAQPNWGPPEQADVTRANHASPYQPADVALPSTGGIALGGYSGRLSEPQVRPSPAEGVKEGFYSGRPAPSATQPGPPASDANPYAGQEGYGRPALSATQPGPPASDANPYAGQEGYGRPALSATQPGPPASDANPYAGQEGYGRPALSATRPGPPAPAYNPYGGREGFGRPAPAQMPRAPSPNEGAKPGFYTGRPAPSARGGPRAPSPNEGAKEGFYSGRPAPSATQPRREAVPEGAAQWQGGNYR